MTIPEAERLIDLLAIVDDEKVPCLGPFSEWWTSSSVHETRQASAMCRETPCPVLESCRLWAYKTRQKGGVWGGETLGTRERKRNGKE